ncbi:MAG: GNAT family N-acetyltransferase [Myxococcota bacterium]
MVALDMPGPLRVRALTEADHARWLELWAGYLEFYEVELDPGITETTWRRLIGDDDGTHEGVVAVDDDGVIVGFAHALYHRSTWTEGWYCYLEDLFVDPACRGKGAGQVLIEAVVKDAKARDTARVFLITNESNARARALYDKVMTLAPFVQYRVQLKGASTKAR